MGQLFTLDKIDVSFPDISYALDEPNGLLAVGGDLSMHRLIAAYRQGIFPWYQHNQPILWWSPDPRCVIEPSVFKTSRSLKKKIARQEFELRVDYDFPSVIVACSRQRVEASTWITDDMISAYIDLHHFGVAHSIECYQEEKLVGGLYGLSIGSLFFGESMFHISTDASKVAFAYLMERMEDAGSPLVDCQLANPHLFSLGAFEIPRSTYRHILEQHINDPEIDWASFTSS